MGYAVCLKNGELCRPIKGAEGVVCSLGGYNVIKLYKDEKSEISSQYHVSESHDEIILTEDQGEDTITLIEGHFYDVYLENGIVQWIQPGDIRQFLKQVVSDEFPVECNVHPYVGKDESSWVTSRIIAKNFDYLLYATLRGVDIYCEDVQLPMAEHILETLRKSYQQNTNCFVVK